MRFGIMGSCTGPYDALAARVRSAEKAGFDTAWVDDDIFTPSLCEHEPWTLLAALSLSGLVGEPHLQFDASD